jgi:monofunctional glycosyltransferase
VESPTRRTLRGEQCTVDVEKDQALHRISNRDSMIGRLILAASLAVIGALWFYYLVLPWPIRLQHTEPDRTAFMRQRAAEARAAGEAFDIRHEWVALDRISRNLRRAVVVAEDARYYEHGGIDWAALREEFRYSGDDDFSILDADDLRALFASYRYYRANRERIRGRSTITQQLAKNLYFGDARSTVRKVEELIVARRLERFLEKDRILELYLNVAEWGPGIFGAEAAARHYFGRSASDLTPAQAAALAATLPHPLTSNPSRNPGRMRWRQQLILQRMGGTGPAETVPLAPEDEAPRRPEPLGVPVSPEPPPPPPDTLPPPQPPPPDTLSAPR